MKSKKGTPKAAKVRPKCVKCGSAIYAAIWFERHGIICLKCLDRMLSGLPPLGADE